MFTESMFNEILDQDEEIRWSGQPNFKTFMLSGVPFLIFGFIWGLFDLFFVVAAFFSTGMPGKMGFFLIPFMAVHSFPAWGSVLYMFWLYFSHGNTAYAFTNKRVLMRSGVFGTDFQIIDYDRIRDMQVNVGPIEKMCHVGSILFNTGEVTVKGHPLLKRFSGIENPYDVFRQLKEVSLDVKADISYPNAKRPETNPGYNTQYKPEERE